MSASITDTSDRSTSASGNDVPLRPCKKMESLVILDTETTCLPSPGKRPKITELCFLSILTDEILTQGQVPRVVSKLTLCFNPRQAIDPGASKVTGLFNDTLEKMETFQKQASLITSFLACLPRPLCLIAHNGLHFDFPLLVAELLNASSDGVLGLSSGIFCADSLEAFRMFDGLPAQPEWRMKKQEKESKLRRQPPPHDCALAVMGASEECTKRSAEKFMEKDSTCSDTSNPKILKLDMPTESITTTSSSLVEAEADMKWSQVSITDSQLVTGRTIVSETEELKQNISNTETKSDGWEHCETTPCRQFSLSSANVAEQFQKKEGAISVSMAEKERVSRRLFNEEQRGELQATANFSPDEATDRAELSSRRNESLDVTATPYVSYRLGHIYRRVFGKLPDIAHTAEDDCNTLLKLILHRSKDFLAWVERHAIPLESVQPMY